MQKFLAQLPGFPFAYPRAEWRYNSWYPQKFHKKTAAHSDGDSEARIFHLFHQLILLRRHDRQFLLEPLLRLNLFRQLFY